MRGARGKPEKVTLLTGATGYVGGRLLDAFEQRRIPVRCLARRPEQLKHHVATTTEVVRGDVFDAASLVEAMRGVDTAYYLIHSMGSTGDFEVEGRMPADPFEGEPLRGAHAERIPTIEP